MYKKNNQSNKVHVVKHLGSSSTSCDSFIFPFSSVRNIFIFNKQYPNTNKQKKRTLYFHGILIFASGFLYSRSKKINASENDL